LHNPYPTKIKQNNFNKESATVLTSNVVLDKALLL